MPIAGCLMIRSPLTPPAYQPTSRFPVGKPPVFGRMELDSTPFTPPPIPATQPAVMPATSACLLQNSNPSPVQQFVSPGGYPLTVYTLSNGHRLMVEQRPSDYIGVRTFVDSGSVVEDAVKP